MSKTPKKKSPLARLRGREPNEEIASLRAQLEDQQTNMQKILEEQEVENTRKEEVIRKVGEKFKRVQRGLNRMEKERNLANSNKEKAEKENHHLRNLLQIRDKELQTLNFQAAVGEGNKTSSYDPAADLEKVTNIPVSIDVPSSARVSIPDNQVNKLMTNLEVQLSLRDEHVEKLNADMQKLETKMRDSLALERMLRESEGQQTLMKSQLERMENDYEEVMNATAQCFDNMKFMSINYKVKEAERTEVIWEANRCIAEQRAVHLENCKKMAKELYSQQSRIQELEALTGSSGKKDKEDGEGKKAVPLEKIVLENSRAAAFACKQMEHEREMQKLVEENEQRMVEAQDANRQELDTLNEILLEKEREISSLREDISGQMDRMMNMSTEIRQLQEDTPMEDTPMAIEIEQKQDPDVDGSIFSDAYDSELEIERSQSGSVASLDIDERESQSGSSLVRKKKKTASKALFSGSVNEDASVTVETRSLHTLREEEDVDNALLAAKDVELAELRREKASMVTKLSDVGGSIQDLERKVDTEQATVNLLKTNLDMMEQAMIEKDKKILELIVDVREKEEILADISRSADLSRLTGLSSTDASPDAKKSFETVTLQAELDVLKDKFKTETAIMQAMIRVLNGQVYQAMKALEGEQKKTRSISAPVPIVEEADERVAALEQDLESLHRKSQMALQLSQAEVAALKSKLENEPISMGEPYTLGLDWLSTRRSRSPSRSPPGSPQKAK